MRVGDPWWRTHFPPNGWGCRCIVEQLSDDDLERRGYAPLPDNVRPAEEGITRPWHNDRTGETIQVPVGIDPGWAHNAGLVDPVAGARAVLRGKLAAAPPAQRAALLDTWEDYVAEGRAARDEIERGISETPGTVEHANAFRAGLRKMLRERRAAGELDAEIGPFREAPPSDPRRKKASPGVYIEHRDDQRLAEAVRTASREFPRSWVEAGNRRVQLYARAAPPRRGGAYYGPDHDSVRGVRKPIGTGAVYASPQEHDVVLHEYAHHLQAAMPGLDARFQAFHRARTADDPQIRLKRYRRAKGRPDQYVDEYVGREYGESAQALEVMTMACELLLAAPTDVGGKPSDYVRMLNVDPEMAELAIGLLMRYDPEP